MLISYPGELFMRLLKLMILPLVIASLISGMYHLLLHKIRLPKLKISRKNEVHKFFIFNVKLNV